MSLKSSFGGDGYSGNSASSGRMGIFSTNNNQHDSVRPGQTNKYNITNKYSSPLDPLASPQAAPADAAKNNSARNYSYQAVSEGKHSSSLLRSPALVARVGKINKVQNTSQDFFSYHSRSDSGSSRSSSASTGTVCEGEVFPYGRGIKPQQRSLRSSSPPLRTVTKQRTQENYDASKEMSTNNKVAAVTEQISSAELESKSSEKLSEVCEGVKAVAGGVRASGRKLTPDLEMNVVVSKDIARDRATLQPRLPTSLTRLRMESAEDDSHSVSTVSGSGIDFFRKFVQRKTSSCKDCEEQFRREVLIDRLVSDSINTKAVLARKGSGVSSRSSTASSSVASALLSSEAGSTRPTSELTDNSHNSVNHSLIVSSLGMHEIEQKARGCASRCKTHRNNLASSAMCDEIQSISTKSSLSRSSSISGSGLLFLRNYLKKKKSKSKTGPGQSEGSFNKDDPKNISAFNIVPVPFPPPSDFYGPAYFPDGGPDNQESLSEDTSSGRRHSLCSTVADLLNEDFDCDDTELKNLDWEEWDEPLPDEMSYDDLVSVISESFYSEEVDLSELCELDWEGRKTVVAAEHQVISTTPSNSRGQELRSNLTDYKSASPEPAASVEAAIDIPLSSSKSKYSSRSSTFLLDLEAELALPPMTPVSDEKEEAVRALSRSIKQYMRTGSNSSYTSCGSSGTGQAVTAPDRRHSRLSNYHNEQGRYSRKSTGDELERNSRMSVYSPAMSDYLPELVSTNSSSACVSPLQGGGRRPLSQLLIYDCPPGSDTVSSPALPVRPTSQIYCYDNNRNSRISRERSKTPSPELRITENSNRANSMTCGYIFGHTREGKAAELPSVKHEIASGAGQRLGQRPGSKAANRDSLLCPYTPPLCPSPGLQGPLGPAPGHSPAVSATRHFIRHSSTDSGCHLLEEKIASVSPTPSPRTNIESVLNNNRNKLASFWEKSVSNSVVDIHHSWLPNKEGGTDDSPRHGFKPFRSAFGSENSLIVTDRLNHFQDLTRRAAERNVIVGRPGQPRAHRASTGSDCSDFLDKITLSPAQPRRRESFNEYFV